MPPRSPEAPWPSGYNVGALDANGNDPILNITGYNNTTAATPGSSGAGTDDRLVFQGDQSAVLGDFNFGSGPGVGVSEIALDNGYFEVFDAVPEPSTWGGGVLVFVAMAWHCRRGSRQAVSASDQRG